MKLILFFMHNINSLGLILDIIGVILLWKFGLPPDVRRDGNSFLIVGRGNNDEIIKAKKYDFLAQVALGFILFGFLLQLVGSLMQ